MRSRISTPGLAAAVIFAAVVSALSGCVPDRASDSRAPDPRADDVANNVTVLFHPARRSEAFDDFAGYPPADDTT